MNYYGKYRGTVVDNVDPQHSGRLLVSVPDVRGNETVGWALACVPLAGQQMGTWFLPPVGANVWVEFEKGDPNCPIWSGSWWSPAAEAPALALAGTPSSPNIVLQTAGQNMLMISGESGSTDGILLKTSSGASIAISDVGITISNGKGATIVLTGPTVNVNAGALTVT